MLIEYYLITYKQLSLTELIEEFNSVDNKVENLPRLLVISTYLIHKLSYLQRHLISDLELLTSVSLDLIQNKVSKKNYILTLDDVAASLNSEVNPFNIMLFKGINNYFPVEYHEPNSLENVIIKTFKNELLEDCPAVLRLALSNYLNTGELNINNYSEIDRYTLKLLLFESGIPMEINVNLENFTKLNTTVEKAVFLYFLKCNFPAVFVLLTSIKDINRVLLLVECNSLLKNLSNIIIPAIEDSATRALKYVSESDLNQSKVGMYTKIAKEIKFGIENTNLGNLMSDALNDTYSEYDKVLKAVINRSEFSGDLNPLASLLNSESSQSVNLLMKLNKK